MGAIKDREGGTAILTGIGKKGHAIYGPYEKLAAGRHIASFEIALAEPSDGANLLCGFVDVVANSGNEILAVEPLFCSQIDTAFSAVTLGFELSEPKEVEYRVYANGQVPLLIADTASATPEGEVPWRYRGPTTDFITRHKDMLARLCNMGVKIAAAGDYLVMEMGGVRFGARTYDDVNFVHELFVLNAYNMLTAAPTCVIDIGMNVALAALQFATKDFVKEIHTFEPFKATYDRGLANIALNPSLAAKIKTNNFGLGDRDGDLTLKIYDSGDSGAMSTYDSEQGIPMTIPMRETSGALRPIIASARERGLEVMVKVDCEGSEFPVFESLAKSGLLGEIRGFMVEWHRVFEGRNQDELLAPLLANGYVVFDVSPPTGNGFFYATRFD
jgi:FkbM family methyltransferase